MKFNPKVGDLVYMQWDDHCSYMHPGWKPLSDLGHRLMPSICETAGFVIHINAECITTVASVAFNDEGDDGSQIATRMRKTIRHGKVIKRYPRPKDV